MLSYATQFISLSTTDYHVVWWRLFHSPNSSDWTNVLALTKLLFTLPVSNGKLERVFSTMKNIKLENRSSMSNDTLDDLLTLNIDKATVEDFNPDSSIDLWWRAKARWPSQNPRKKSQVSVTTDEESDNTTDSETENILDDWDKWFS